MNVDTNEREVTHVFFFSHYYIPSRIGHVKGMHTKQLEYVNSR